MRNLVLVPVLGYIKVAVATTELGDVRHAVNTGAYDIAVIFAIAGKKPAGAAHITVSLLVQDQGVEQFEGSFPVLIEIISL
jgi:hypothetical protein